jgi:hypothetical protein
MMSPCVKTDFIVVGGNRHPAAADWDAAGGLVAFAADRSVAVWPALVTSSCTSLSYPFFVNALQGQGGQWSLRITVWPYRQS